MRQNFEKKIDNTNNFVGKATIFQKQRVPLGYVGDADWAITGLFI